MAYLEVDSFVKKFKILAQAGRNASLTLSSNAGKAVLNLRVDLGVLEANFYSPCKRGIIYDPARGIIYDSS